ncbi:hypothetical protein HZ326_5515 [Fusarium oxysporum f. sp. albedinis]|nr:hypothetical protein HZ326_5515 [Fusarium oxysporum f. sp. albedinis]
MAGKGTWKDEAQHARDMGLSEERQCDVRHATVGITMKIVNQMQGPTVDGVALVFFISPRPVDSLAR